MTTTKKINNAQAISENLYGLLEKKVSKISKKSTLQMLQLDDLQELKNKEIILGIYSCQNENETFIVHKIFIDSDIMIKGSYKQYNIISNALLQKNKNKEKITQKVNIYNNQDNEKLCNTFVEFIKNKLNEDNIAPGEYLLAGLKLQDLLDLEI